LDALFRNEEGAIDGVSVPPPSLRHTCVRFTIDDDTAAAVAQFGKTRKEISTHKCAITWLLTAIAF